MLCAWLRLFRLSAGTLHFIDPQWFEPIVPPIPGSARFWVYISGAIELALGIGFIVPSSRKITGLGSATFWCAFTPQMSTCGYMILNLATKFTYYGRSYHSVFHAGFGVLLSLWVWKFRTQDNQASKVTVETALAAKTATKFNRTGENLLSMVLKAGLEPARAKLIPLKIACLPIPPLRHNFRESSRLTLPIDHSSRLLRI